MKTQVHLNPAPNPETLLEALGKPTGQKPHLRVWRPGFDHYLSLIPRLETEDPLLGLKVEVTRQIIARLGNDLLEKAPWVHEKLEAGRFERNIVAVEGPSYDVALDFLLAAQNPEVHPQLPPPHSGPELVVAKWGAGLTTKPHGHVAGFMHDEILLGKALVNHYRWVGEKLLRPVRSVIHDASKKNVNRVMASNFGLPDERHKFMNVLHSVTALTPVTSLHYMGEHPLDGAAGNLFEVEQYPIVGTDVERIDSDEALHDKPGSVILVRSENVPDFGDHFIIITGPNYIEDNGLRPRQVTIQTTDWGAKEQLSLHKPHRGLVLLKLDDWATRQFHEFHGISVVDGHVSFFDGTK